MDINKNIIKLIQDRITPMDSEWDKINITREFHRDDYRSLDVIIKLLKCGEENARLLKEVITMLEDNVENSEIIKCIIGKRI